MARSNPATAACSILWVFLFAAPSGCSSSGSAGTNGPVLTGGSTAGSGGVAGGGTSGAKSTGGTTATGDNTVSSGTAGAGGTATGGTATAGATTGYGGSGGRIFGTAGGATSVDAAAPDVPQVDAPAVDAKVAPLDGSLDSTLDGSPAEIDAVRACKNTSATQPSMGCRSFAECGGLAETVKCCTAGPCWPASACPIPPSMCQGASGRLLCTTNQDCNPGGTCVSTVSGCPQCESSSCQYPPPPCTQSPDSCSPNGRCQPEKLRAPGSQPSDFQTALDAIVAALGQASQLTVGTQRRPGTFWSVGRAAAMAANPPAEAVRGVFLSRSTDVGEPYPHAGCMQKDAFHDE
jgi:hypothetical protein